MASEIAKGILLAVAVLVGTVIVFEGLFRVTVELMHKWNVRQFPRNR